MELLLFAEVIDKVPTFAQLMLGPLGWITIACFVCSALARKGWTVTPLFVALPLAAIGLEEMDSEFTRLAVAEGAGPVWLPLFLPILGWLVGLALQVVWRAGQRGEATPDPAREPQRVGASTR